MSTTVRTMFAPIVEKTTRARGYRSHGTPNKLLEFQEVVSPWSCKTALDISFYPSG